MPWAGLKAATMLRSSSRWRSPPSAMTVNHSAVSGPNTNATFAVPWFTDAGLFYYRTDLLEDAGFSEPPRTWDEMKEMAARITRDGGAAPVARRTCLR